MKGLLRNALGIGVLLSATASVSAFVACSSSNSSGQGSSGGNHASPCTTVIKCDSPALGIVFTPMYSAYIPGDNTHTFKIPAVVNGIEDQSVVTWGVSDPSAVSCENDPTTGGVMITVQKAENVTIVAQAGGLCASSPLNVTSATDSDWQAGNSRYNSGVPLYLGCIGLSHHMPEGGCPDAGPACTACHGATATSSYGFNDVAHTPEQTGGFSDQDLMDIIVNGQVPEGGYFDPSIVPYDLWTRFHNWSDIQADTQRGMVVYLRSLEPTAQNGSVDFGGRYGRDGGYEGGHRYDGGFGGSSSGGGGSSSGAGSSSSGSGGGSSSGSGSSEGGTGDSGGPADATVE
jgi:hypothetical protein